MCSEKENKSVLDMQDDIRRAACMEVVATGDWYQRKYVLSSIHSWMFRVAVTAGAVWMVIVPVVNSQYGARAAMWLLGPADISGTLTSSTTELQPTIYPNNENPIVTYAWTVTYSAFGDVKSYFLQRTRVQVVVTPSVTVSADEIAHALNRRLVAEEAEQVKSKASRLRFGQSTGVLIESAAKESNAGQVNVIVSNEDWNVENTLTSLLNAKSIVGWLAIVSCTGLCAFLVPWQLMIIWRNAARGMCMRCGYQWGDLRRCPECGLKRP